ncbi:hypothetical protein U0C82_12875 [Fulvimarina sp. 2208YS6-2-32]|uniref:Uncharacterized protein n=1 Tax=Fulvimarina uroteuthidis TaxID=3098149 RepID=A0ABU5I5M2_9HYPH|nr:hypothetical protein [Fulvimarina sp. 2208YS6-2-32]MDY8110033.1 hypothetical protein [Fulvimarina sp. 2208YS6-2-32]
MPIEIDIKTRIIADDHRVLIARPGAKYRLHSEFYNRNFVGVELPGLFDENEQISFQDENIVARVKRSLAIRRWLTRAADEDEPTHDLADYDNQTVTPSIRQYMRLLQYYLVTAAQGDLVLNPPMSFDGMVQIGEVTPQANPRLYQVEQYGQFGLVGIPVRWVGKLPKQSLPASSLEALKKPTALFAVGPQQRDKIYAAAYGNYTYKDLYVSSFATLSERYGSFEELIFQSFVNSVALNTQRIDLGRDDVVSLSAAAAFLIENGEIELGDYGLDLNININSPGIISLISSKITPIVAVTIFTLAVLHGGQAFTEIAAGQLIIGNSSAEPGDPCAALVHQQTYAQIQLLGWDKWVPECERLLRLREETGLGTRTN